MPVHTGPFSLERAAAALEKVRKRLLRTAEALQGAGVVYAIAGGNAVALWVSRVDESVVRNTQDADVLIRRADFAIVNPALEAAGFVHRHAAGMEVFLDGPPRSRGSGFFIALNERIGKDRRRRTNAIITMVAP